MMQKPLILAVETSGRTGSAAIALGEQLLAELAFSAPMKHSAELLPVVSQLLKQFDKKPADIEHIYISVGPGSFTGLRIAVTFAKTMHLANNTIKIVAVNTLDAIAANADDYIKETGTTPSKIAAILDAKRSQFFIAVYQHKQDRWEKTLPDCLMTASQFTNKFADNEPVWLLGEGLLYYKDKFKADGIGFLDESYWYPKASKVHLLGWQMADAGRFADALTLQPNYLRRPDVKIKQN